MSDDITIPPEALEAAAQELFEQFLFLFIKEDGDPYTWDEVSEEQREDIRDKARAACIAMLRAWPGMTDGTNWQTRPPCLILPLLLPQEKTDD